MLNTNASMGSPRTGAPRNTGSRSCGLISGTSLFTATAAVALAASSATAEVMLRDRAPSIAPATAPDTPQSRLTITGNVPFDKAAALINRYQLVTHAKGKYASFISYDGVFSVGRLKFAASDEDRFPIRIEAPFDLKGTVGLSDLDETGQALVDVGISVQENWCPIVEFGKVSVKLDDKPRRAAVTQSIPNYGDFVATQFLSSQLSNWATCDNVKLAIGQFWHPIAFAMDTDEKSFLNVDPRSIAFSQFAVSGNNLKFVAAITAAASVGSKKANTAVKPLPNVVPLPASGMQSDVELTVLLNLGTP